MPSLRRLMPNSLSARILAVVLVALFVGQGLLFWVLKARESGVVQELVERQALLQTAALVRLAREVPPGQMDEVVAAFNSRSTCASLTQTAPPNLSMDGEEQAFAGTLHRMIGNPPAEAPHVALQQVDRIWPDCPQSAQRDSRPQPQDETSGRALQVTVDMPAENGRWLHVITVIDLPPAGMVQIVTIFIGTAILVAVIAIAAIRTQTRTLQALAGASERAGRGEDFAPLDEAGPSDVAAAARAFNLMRARHQDFIDDRMKMLAAIGHDLRTPLTTLRLKAEFLDDGNRENFIRTIDEMIVIAEATLALSGLEAEAEKSEVADLHDMLCDLEDEFLTRGHRVSFQGAAPLKLVCRPVALKRVLRNLIENAVRYGKTAVISAERWPRGLVIRIDDEGPGIAPEHMENLFKPFARLDESRNLHTGGIGMGLPIARGIVKSHGGEIVLLNLPDGGLRAEVFLPAG